MKHEGLEFDDYTPENVSGVKGNTIAILITIFVIAILFAFGKWADIQNPKVVDDHIVIDTTTVSTAERPPIEDYSHE